MSESEEKKSPELLETQKLLSKLMHGSGSFELLWDNKDDLLVSWNKSKEASEALKDMKAQEALNVLPPKSKALTKLFAYLGLVESLGVTLMDMALMLCIANGKEMHTYKGGGIMHISTLKDLRKLNLSYKIEFLKANKLGFVGGVVNNDLRNDIAHLKFLVEENGEVRGSNGRTVNIDDTLTDFWKRVGEIIHIFDHIEFLPFIQQKKIETNNLSTY
jgi:hypothetical protein